MPSSSKIINLHPPSAGEIPGPETSSSKTLTRKPSIQATSVHASQVPAPAPEQSVKLPNITVRLGVDRVVFLITDLQEPPELDAYAPEDCQMRFHLLPGLLLTSPESRKTEPQQSEVQQSDAQQPRRQIVCPLLLDHKILPAKAQILQAAMERENPFYGLSMFAKILELPEYLNLVPPEFSARLPYDLVKELFPDEATAIKPYETVTTDPDTTATPNTPPVNSRAAAMRALAPVKVNFTLPTGHPLPQLYRGKIVRISLSLYARAGGLALNDRSVMSINSRSRPTRIHVASLADDYYQLRGTGLTLPATSDLPDFHEDYTDITDPMAALLARKGIGL